MPPPTLRVRKIGAFLKAGSGALDSSHSLACSQRCWRSRNLGATFRHRLFSLHFFITTASSAADADVMIDWVVAQNRMMPFGASKNSSRSDAPLFALLTITYHSALSHHHRLYHSRRRSHAHTGCPDHWRLRRDRPGDRPPLCA